MSIIQINATHLCKSHGQSIWANVVQFVLVAVLIAPVFCITAASAISIAAQLWVTLAMVTAIVRRGNVFFSY